MHRRTNSYADNSCQNFFLTGGMILFIPQKVALAVFKSLIGGFKVKVYLKKLLLSLFMFAKKGKYNFLDRLYRTHIWLFLKRLLVFPHLIAFLPQSVASFPQKVSYCPSKSCFFSSKGCFSHTFLTDYQLVINS